MAAASAAHHALHFLPCNAPAVITAGKHQASTVSTTNQERERAGVPACWAQHRPAHKSNQRRSRILSSLRLRLKILKSVLTHRTHATLHQQAKSPKLHPAPRLHAAAQPHAVSHDTRCCEQRTRAPGHGALRPSHCRSSCRLVPCLLSSGAVLQLQSTGASRPTNRATHAVNTPGPPPSSSQGPTPPPTHRHCCAACGTSDGRV
mmetsp:Transcript_31223/g.79611  ORF Transcript_31223/g.79611 Transcript_31223/m.79611 type:complete len:204 (+) Transcript_31223:218-829(+)